MKINFVLIGEGTSDLRMLTHIENILIAEGFDEVSGKALLQEYGNPPIGNTVSEKITAARRQFPNANLFIVHRDADGAGVAARRNEISKAFLDLEPDLSTDYVCMIPVRMLEAWLLACPRLINRVAGSKFEDSSIKCLPALKQLESKVAAKDLLLEALCEASGVQGGRLASFKKRFFEMRARLTEDLEVDGPQNQLPSYAAFRDDLRSFATRLVNP